jgi:hypothetical protein
MDVIEMDQVVGGLKLAFRNQPACTTAAATTTTALLINTSSKSESQTNPNNNSRVVVLSRTAPHPQMNPNISNILLNNNNNNMPNCTNHNNNSIIVGAKAQILTTGVTKAEDGMSIMSHHQQRHHGQPHSNIQLVNGLLRLHHQNLSPHQQQQHQINQAAVTMSRIQQSQLHQLLTQHVNALSVNVNNNSNNQNASECNNYTEDASSASNSECTLSVVTSTVSDPTTTSTSTCMTPTATPTDGTSLCGIPTTTTTTPAIDNNNSGAYQGSDHGTQIPNSWPNTNHETEVWNEQVSLRYVFPLLLAFSNLECAFLFLIKTLLPVCFSLFLDCPLSSILVLAVPRNSY